MIIINLIGSYAIVGPTDGGGKSMVLNLFFIIQYIQNPQLKY